MERRDLDQVLAIECAFSAPWTREMFLQELQQHRDASEPLVAVAGDMVLGYVLCWFVADEVHIVNLAVHAKVRRRGIARRLMHEVFERALARGLSIATLEVRFHNSAAIQLYEALGFRKIAIRKAYYADNGEDALVMLKDLGADSPDLAAAPAARPKRLTCG
ncbi:MAG: ribosomal protein S18-alanine N-acetyltransferase [Candidatus Krumholzibacteriia bacterium]